MNLCFDQDIRFPTWAAQKLDIPVGYFGNCSSISMLDDSGNIKAVCVYSNFNGVNVEATVAAESTFWLRKDILRVLFLYPFKQLQAKRITLLIDKRNKKVRNLVIKIGFVIEGKLRKFMNDGGDCMTYSMLDDEWRMKYV